MGGEVVVQLNTCKECDIAAVEDGRRVVKDATGPGH